MNDTRRRECIGTKTEILWRHFSSHELILCLVLISVAPLPSCGCQSRLDQRRGCGRASRRLLVAFEHYVILVGQRKNCIQFIMRQGKKKERKVRPGPEGCYNIKWPESRNNNNGKYESCVPGAM